MSSEEDRGKAPSFLLYPANALESDVLKPVAFKAYWLVLWWMWLNSEDHCSIQNSQGLIQRIAKLTKTQYATAWMGEVMFFGAEMLKVEGERLVSNGLRKQAQRQSARRKQAKEAADKRWSGMQPHDSGIAKPHAKPCPSVAVAVSSSVTKKDKQIYIDVIDYLNEKAGTKFKPSTKSSQGHINARLKEGATLEDFKAVIDNKVADWKNDGEWSKYLRPATLFNGEKFEGYLNASPIKPTTAKEEKIDEDFMKRVLGNENDDEPEPIATGDQIPW